MPDDVLTLLKVLEIGPIATRGDGVAIRGVDGQLLPGLEDIGVEVSP